MAIGRSEAQLERASVAQKIIFDTDPGIDDAMALLFAQASDAIDLIGITTTYGNASVEQTTRNAVYLKQRFGFDCPIHMGLGGPLHALPEQAAYFVHGHDGLGDAGFEIPPLSSDVGDAVQFIIDTVDAYPGEITLVAVGRMTNLAVALTKAPRIAQKVKEVVIMGGAIGRHGWGGNVTPVAEANIIGDPHAADIVMRGEWMVTMVGLDVTMQTIMMPQHVEELAEKAGDAGQFIAKIAPLYQSFYASAYQLSGFAVHDSSALAYVIDPDLYTVELGAIRVATEGIAYGQTVFAKAGRRYDAERWGSPPPKQVCVDVDAEAMLSLYMTTLING